MFRGWEEPLAREPKGVYRHSDGRPVRSGRGFLGRDDDVRPALAQRGDRHHAIRGARAVRVLQEVEQPRVGIAQDRDGFYQFHIEPSRRRATGRYARS